MSQKKATIIEISSKEPIEFDNMNRPENAAFSGESADPQISDVHQDSIKNESRN